MFNYLKGKIYISNTYITVDVNDVGYKVFVSNPFIFEEAKESKVYVYQYIKEYENSLYGFKLEKERNLFVDLISVKGIGPKAGLSILSANDYNLIINSIINGDTIFLSKFPKIGPKSASQIVLDLGGKYSKEKDKSVENTINHDIISALINLGYKEKEVVKYVQKLDSNIKLEEGIKIVLGELIR